MRIAIVSDAWAPQVNGVVRTLTTTVAQLRARGHEVETITPEAFTTVPCPSYPEIRLAIAPRRQLRRRLDAFAPAAVHIATEGPLGWAARRWCLDRGAAFTTSFHTRFPDYVALRTGLSPERFWPLVRRFHGPAAKVFVATATLEAELRGRGFPRLHRWTRGVADLNLFRPDGPTRRLCGDDPHCRDPFFFTSAGYRSTRKECRGFPVDGCCRLQGGRRRRALAPLSALGSCRTFSDTLFLGMLHGKRLAAAYRSADAFVFPSLTDTFGLVMVEALASGTPVAAFPVPGPRDVPSWPIIMRQRRWTRTSPAGSRGLCVATRQTAPPPAARSAGSDAPTSFSRA